MIGLVLVTHGRLAAEFITAMEHVVGPQEAIEAVCIGPDDDMEARRKDIAAAIQNVERGKGVIILTEDGGPGNDVLIGSHGDDIMMGGDGDDILNGGPGLDVLDGGVGNNVLIQ